MANYELTVSMGYVPTWTHVDAVREIFQNAKDEETVNPENKMFFDYNEETETLMIENGNRKANSCGYEIQNPEKIMDYVKRMLSGGCYAVRVIDNATKKATDYENEQEN